MYLQGFKQNRKSNQFPSIMITIPISLANDIPSAKSSPSNYSLQTTKQDRN